MISNVLRKVQEWKERITVKDIHEVIRVKQRQMEELAHDINVLHQAIQLMEVANGQEQREQTPQVPLIQPKPGMVPGPSPNANVLVPADTPKRWP